jgi:hypothetical protein
MLRAHRERMQAWLDHLHALLGDGSDPPDGYDYDHVSLLCQAVLATCAAGVLEELERLSARQPG